MAKAQLGFLLFTGRLSLLQRIFVAPRLARDDLQQLINSRAWQHVTLWLRTAKAQIFMLRFNCRLKLASTNICRVSLRSWRPTRANRLIVPRCISGDTAVNYNSIKCKNSVHNLMLVNLCAILHVFCLRNSQPSV